MQLCGKIIISQFLEFVKRFYEKSEALARMALRFLPSQSPAAPALSKGEPYVAFSFSKFLKGWWGVQRGGRENFFQKGTCGAALTRVSSSL